MPTYLVSPPPFDRRMAFMDAVQEAGMHIDRTPEGFEVTTNDSQEETWIRIKEQFDLDVGTNEPPIMII